MKFIFHRKHLFVAMLVVGVGPSCQVTAQQVSVLENSPIVRPVKYQEKKQENGHAIMQASIFSGSNQAKNIEQSLLRQTQTIQALQEKPTAASGSDSDSPIILRPVPTTGEKSSDSTKGMKPVSYRQDAIIKKQQYQTSQSVKPLLKKATAGVDQQVHSVPSPPKSATNSANQDGGQEPKPELKVNSNARYFDSSCRNGNCNLGDGFRLLDRPERGLRIGGWIQNGWYQEQTGLFNRAPRQRVHLNQAWLFAEKKFNGDRFDVTLRGDIVYGIDAQRLQAFGNTPFGTANDWDNSLDHGNYGWALPQLYADVDYGQGKIRSGHFLSPFGYENGASVENFFYTRTFSYTNSQPHTLTGALVDHQISNKTGIYGGYTYGWDSAFDDAGDAGIFGFHHRTDGGALISYGSSFGQFGQRGNGYFQNLSAAFCVSSKLNVAVETTWLDTNLTEDFGVAAYGIYKFNDCFSAGSRVEYWRSEAAGGGGQISAHSYTFGLNYRPHSNLVLRPELRTDYGNAAVADGDTSFAIDAVFTF